MTEPINYSYVRQRTKIVAGIHFDEAKDYLIESRLAAVASSHGFSSIPDLIQNLKESGLDSDLEKKVIDALTINETSFFRDTQAFDRLSQAVIPEAIAANRATKSLKIWSAACSTGQEIYSIAILLREKFPELSSWNVSLHATDISDRVLGYARKGVYSDFELKRGLSLELRDKYFVRQNAFDWKIREDLSSRVAFNQHNLFGSWDKLGTYDVIMLRNVLIYFELPEKKTILARAGKHLKPSGYLFLGGSESTYNIDPNWVSDGGGGNSFRLIRQACAETIR